METAPGFNLTSAGGYLCEIVSAVLGIAGTYLMSRRYAPNFLRSLLYAAFWPFLCLIGKGQRARKFFTARAEINKDNPESAGDMALGLNLLFLAFLLQLAALVIK